MLVALNNLGSVEFPFSTRELISYKVHFQSPKVERKNPYKSGLVPRDTFLFVLHRQKVLDLELVGLMGLED